MPSYFTLKYLMVHFNKVLEHSMVNQVCARDLADVFGPILAYDGSYSFDMSALERISLAQFVVTLITNVSMLPWSPILYPLSFNYKSIIITIELVDRFSSNLHERHAPKGCVNLFNLLPLGTSEVGKTLFAP